MKVFVAILLLFAGFFARSQSVYPIRADTVKIYKQGGYAELVLQNKTKDTIGVLVNIGNGQTAFLKSRKINDSSFVVGKDTITIRGGGSITGSGSADSIKHYYVDTGAIAHNNYLLAFDSTNRKWKLVAQSAGGAFDSATSQGGVFHTLLFNDSRYVRKTDSAGAGYQTFARGNKIKDSLLSVLNALLALKVNITDSAGPGYQTFARGLKLRDSLLTIIALKRDIADTVSFAGTATNGHLQKIIDSLLALTDTSIYRATGNFGTLRKGFYLSASGKTNTISIPSIRDSLDYHSALAGDSAAVSWVQAHDSISGNALATKYDVDTMRARIGPGGGGGSTPGLQAVIAAGPNLTGDNTIGLATHKLTISGGPVWADSVKIAGLDSVVKAWLAILNIFGDSFNNPGPGTTSQDSIASIRFADSLKIPYNNFATSGTGVMVAITRADSLVNGPFNNCMTWWQIGYNDLRASGADARTPLKVVAADCAGMVNNFASKYVSASDTTSSILKRWGTFTTGILAGISCPVKMKAAASTTTINDSITYKGNGRYFGVVLIAGDSLTFVHSIVNIFVDNVFYKTVNTNGVADGTAVVAGHTDSRIPFGVAIDAGSSGIHTIKLVNTQARIMMVDYFAVLSTNRPTFMLFHTIYPVASPTVYINLNNAIDSMRATWPAAFNILDIPVNDKFDRTTGLWTDATHPNDRGQGQIDRSALDQWNALANYTNQQVTADAAGLFYTDKGKERVMNSKEVWTRSDPAVNLPGYLSVGLGMSYKINGVDVFKPDVALKNYSIGNGAGVTMTTPTATGNNWFGDLAGNTCTTCANNSGYGTGSMQLITTGTANSGFGNFSLQNNSSGGSNTAGGHSSLHGNTTGSSNTAFGQGALAANTTASNNSAHGASALAANTTGTGNTADGFQALLASTTSNFNTADGDQALVSNTSGAQNTSSGAFSTAFNTTGIGNSVFGYKSLYGNASTAAYNYNTAGGYQAGQYAHTDSSIYMGAFVGQTAVATTFTGHGKYLIGTITDTPRTTSSSGDISCFNATITGDAAKRSLAINVPIGSQTPSTQFEVGGTTGAVLIPRLNTTQMNALTAVDGMRIYNTDSAADCIRAGGSWNKILTSLTGGAGITLSAGKFFSTTSNPTNASASIDSVVYSRVGNTVTLKISGGWSGASAANSQFEVVVPITNTTWNGDGIYSGSGSWYDLTAGTHNSINVYFTSPTTVRLQMILPTTNSGNFAAIVMYDTQ